MAGHLGPFDGFAVNREPMLRVMEMHRDAVAGIASFVSAGAGGSEAQKVWDECVDLGRRHGYRNSQVTVIAPTGTIAFMMDCDTTGIEPDIALVKYKNLAGGGMLKIVNRTVPMALRTLGYDEPSLQRMLDYIDKKRHDRGCARAEGGASCRCSTARFRRDGRAVDSRGRGTSR